MSARTPPFLSDARFVYDLADAGKDIYQRFSFENLSTQDFVLASTTQFQRLSDSFDTTTRFTLADMPTSKYIGSGSTMTLLHEGNDTDFDRIYQMYVPLDAIVDRIDFNFAAALNVSAFSAGTFNIGSIIIDMRSFKAQNQSPWSQRLTYAAGLTALTGVDNQVLIVNRSYTTEFPIFKGGMFEMQINVNGTVGTGTYQKGILSTFPYQAVGSEREFSSSGFNMHMRPLPTQGSIMAAGGYADIRGASVDSPQSRAAAEAVRRSMRE